MSPLFSEESHIDRETVLDILVNVIPIVILGFFALLFLLVDPWRFAPTMTFLSIGLTVFPLVLLAILTYVSARVIARDEDYTTERDEDYAMERNGDYAMERNEDSPVEREG